jgi:YHS domain-containing protein
MMQIATLFFNVVHIYYIMFKDPVCNMMVDEKKAQHISEVNGQKVYLCSSNCKSQFDQNPSKYGY